jgi:hypothetical protein
LFAAFWESDNVKKTMFMMGFTHDVIVEIQPIDLKRRRRVTSLVNTLDKPRRENIIITVCI